MELQVLKRDGRKEPFSFEKIEKAIKSAWATIPGVLDFEKVEKKIFNYIYKKIFARSKFSREISVEQIQDIVENCLMKYNKDVARSYIRYRYKHEMIRDRYQDLMDGITTKIMAKDVQNQNANVDENSFGGRVGEMSDYVLKQYALENCMSEMARSNHLNNEIYIHDLSHYAIGDHNCLSLPIDDLLKNGFTTRQVDIRPANSVNTAFQLLAVLFQIQSLCQFG